MTNVIKLLNHPQRQKSIYLAENQKFDQILAELKA